ncbi:MAG: sigma-E factor regulatory protein RseB domain-containing protein [Elusimicrobiota bacterium]
MSTELALLLGLALSPGFAKGPAALDVLRMTLDASEAAYEGEIRVATRKGSQELLVRFSPPARYRRQLLDELGTPALTLVSDGRTEWVYDRRRSAVWKGEPTDPDFKPMDPDEEYGLLTGNYAFALGPEDEVADRDCAVLEVRAKRGSALVQKLWVDRDYGVVLRRQSFGPDGSLSNEMRFVRVSLPAEDAGWDFSFRPPPGVKVEESRIRPDPMELWEAAAVSDLEPRTPGWLPPGFVFESVDLVPYREATLLHFRYTDGVDALSLFQCPSGLEVSFLGAGGADARSVRLAHSSARLALQADRKLLEWASGDRFVLIGSLGLDALRRVADSVK